MVKSWWQRLWGSDGGQAVAPAIPPVDPMTPVLTPRPSLGAASGAVAVGSYDAGAAPAHQPELATLPRMKAAPVAAPKPETVRVDPLNIGGTGFMSGLDIARDGTMVTRGDVFAGYELVPGAERWELLYRDDLIPAPYSAAGQELSDNGCYEIVLAPSDSQRIYMAYQGRIYVRRKRGQPFAVIPDRMRKMYSNRGAQRLWGPHFAVHPSQPDQALFATMDGVVATTNGGLSVAEVAGLPAPAPHNNEPTGPITVTDGKRWFVAVFGAGVFQSATGPLGPFAPMAGSPRDVTVMAIDPTGSLYANSLVSGQLWRFRGTWSLVPTTKPNELPVHAVAINPFDTKQIAVMTANGELMVSHDDGNSWLGPWWPKWPAPVGISLHDDVIGHLDQAEARFFPSALRFDPRVSGRLWAAEGKGIRVIGLPKAFVPLHWQGYSAGIEMAVVNRIMAGPTGRLAVAAWDQPIWVDPKPEAFPAKWLSQEVNHCWDLDYAADDPRWWAANINYQKQLTAFSTDDLATLTEYPSPYAMEGHQWQHPDGFILGGCVAVGRKGEVIWLPGNKKRAVYRTPANPQWQYLSIPGLTDQAGADPGWGWAHFVNRKVVIADKSRPGVFLLYNYGVDQNPARGAGTYLSMTGPAGPWTRVSGHMPGFDAHTRMAFVPGKPGHAFAVAGGDRAHLAMRRTDNDGRNWKEVTAVRGATDVAFGKAAPGAAYPAIYVFGTIGKKRGLFRSTDNADSWTLLTERVGGTLDSVTCLAGDPQRYGVVYVGLNGSGARRVDSSTLTG